MNPALRWLATALASLGAAGACASTAPSSGDSETHWLRSCTRNAECGSAIACKCGLCTIVCAPTEAASCKLGPPGSQCAEGSSARACAGTPSPPQGLCLGAAGTAGTGGTTNSGAATGSAGGPGGGGTTGGGSTITYASNVWEFDYPDSYLHGSAATTPVTGAEVCIVELDGSKDPSVPCATTDSTGRFSLTVPANRELIVMATKPGFRPEVLAFDARSADVSSDATGGYQGIYVRRTEPFPGTTGSAPQGCGWPPCGVPPSDAGSFIFGAIILPGAVKADAGDAVWLGRADLPDGAVVGQSSALHALGVSVSISPMEGSGPIYADYQLDAVPNATRTVGVGGWYQDLSPGMYQITFTHPTMDCTWLAHGTIGSLLGFPGRTPGDKAVFPPPPTGSTDNVLRVPVIAGANTSDIQVDCFPRAP